MNHTTVIKWTTHREVVTLPDAETSARIESGIAAGNELRDVDCSTECFCVKAG